MNSGIYTVKREKCSISRFWWPGRDPKQFSTVASFISKATPRKKCQERQDVI